MKDTLIEIKNNLHENNSRMNEVENQINDLKHKEAKKQPISTMRKKEPPKMGIIAIYQMQSSKHWLYSCSRNLVRTSAA